MNLNYNGSPYVRTLVEIGMTEREAKVYMALLKRQTAMVAELQRDSGVPQSKMYETINSLVRGGFISEKREGRIRSFNIVDPRITLFSGFTDLERRLKESISLKSGFEEMYLQGDNITEAYEYIEIVRGMDNVHHRYVNLLKNAKKELRNFFRPPFVYYREGIRKEQVDAYLEFVERGGQGPFVMELNQDSPAWMVEELENDPDSKDHLRICEKLPIKMTIFDGETLLISEFDEVGMDEELSMTVIKQRTTVKGYMALFDFFWDQGLKYEDWRNEKSELLKTILQNK